MREYRGPDGAQVHVRRSGQGDPIVLLPPAPHTGAYFDPLRAQLRDYDVLAVDYPGYGGSDRIGAPSIPAYAAAIAPHMPTDSTLVGFHTGNLVAAEIARLTEPARIIMIDVPYFDETTRATYAAKLPGTRLPTPVRASYAKSVDGRDASVSETRAFDLWVETLRSGAHQSDAFHAAFAYDPEAGLRDLPCPVHLVATQSGLLEPTRRAAADIGVPLTERMDVSAPVFEAHADKIAETIRTIITGTE